MTNDPYNEQLSVRLKERVKELSCLYEISKIAQQVEMGLELQIGKIIEIVPFGWQFPSNLIVQISYSDKLFGTPIEVYGLRESILVFQEKVGEISVGYQGLSDEKNRFLKEEDQLLSQIAVEVGNLISRHDQIEKERLLNDQMRRDDRLHILAELTAGIAHELNTPLGNILGYSEILKKSINDERKRKDAQKIVSSALSAREIVKKLMYFSCEMPSNFKRVDINCVLNDTCNLLSLRLKESAIKLKENYDKRSIFVNGDHLQLTQVFINIILNAKDAVQQNGQITLITHEEKHRALIKIVDNGPGITAKDRLRIFQPFYTTKKQGTGLGLSVAHGIIQSHQGSIKVSSEVGKGAVFTISLPIAKK